MSSSVPAPAWDDHQVVKGREKYQLWPLSFRARVFAALVGISVTTSLAIGLVLYYFAQDRLLEAERESLIQRSRTANAGAGVFLEGLRDDEDGTLPAPETYAEELVRSVAGPTGLGVLYVGPYGEPLAARDATWQPVPPDEAYQQLGLNEEILEKVEESSQGEGRLVTLSDGLFSHSPRYASVCPLPGTDCSVHGVLAYDSPEDGL